MQVLQFFQHLDDDDDEEEDDEGDDDDDSDTNDDGMDTDMMDDRDSADDTSTCKSSHFLTLPYPVTRDISDRSACSFLPVCRS